MNKYICTIVIMSIMTLSIGIVAGQDINAGKTIFDSKCGGCHRIGGIGPNMTVLYNATENNLKDNIRNGVAGTQMRSFNASELSDTDLGNVIAYIKSQNPSNAPTPMPPVITSYGTPANTAIETPITTVIETPMPPVITSVIETPIPPVITPTPKSPGFDVVLGAIGILLIYRLRQK